MSDWSGALRQRLAGLRLSPAREAEIVEELSQHLDQRYEDLRADGASDEEARRAAAEELLDPETLNRSMRTLRQANLPLPREPGAPTPGRLGNVSQDVRYAARMLLRQPAFAAAAIVTLALGIGVNTAIFALVDATLLRALPLPDPDRLVMVWERTERTPRSGVAPLNLIDWQERTRTFEVLGGMVPNVGGMVMAGADGTAETVPRQWVTAAFFDALGVKPIAGRTFVPDDDRRRADVVVLSEGFWRARFGADPGVIGRDIRLDGSPYTVVGVVPDAAQLLARTSIWAMLSTHGAPPAARGAYFLQAIGRLKPGVTIDAAGADMSAIADALAREFPSTNKGRGITLAPMHEAVFGAELRQTSMLFLGVVAVVLLICCANVANLLLARATTRTRELAIRSALGADRRRIIRQLLTESLLLAGIGGALGLAVGTVILRAAPAMIPQGLLPTAVTLTFDLRLVVFCALAALVVGLLFGLAPAWHATRIEPAPALGAGSRTATSRGGRLRAILVAGEVATAVLLLFGAGLLLRTLLVVEQVDRGYEAESVLTMLVDPLGSQYPNDQAMLQFYETVEHEVMALPGVRSVAWASTLPLGPSYFGRYFFEVVGEAAPVESQRPAADYQIVSPAYFETLDLALVTGRGFDDRDTSASPAVCIVNEAFVRHHLSGRSPIGARLSVRPSGAPRAQPVVREVVGVARQVKGRPDETEELLQIYVPLAQDPVDDIFMVVRPTTGLAGALAAPVRAAIGRVDREQLVSVRSVMTLEDIAWEATARHRFRAILVMAFAGLALLLAMVGLFGILAYSVQQRVREFGVRKALGAGTREVLRPLVSDALRVIAAGAAIGLASCALIGQLLDGLLFGVRPLDPVTLAAVPLVLLLTALLAVAAPAWRALRIDPATALRGE